MRRAQVFRDLGVAHERLAGAAVAARYPQLGVIGLGDAIYEPRGRRDPRPPGGGRGGGPGSCRWRRVPGRRVSRRSTRREPNRWCGRRQGSGSRPITSCWRAARGCPRAARWLSGRGFAPRGRRSSTSACRPATRGSASSTCRCGSTSRPASTASPTSTRTGSRSASTGTARPSIPTPRSGCHRRRRGRAARAFLARRVPALAAAPLLDARVCQYENTSSGDFLIDRHPAWPNVWIVGGGSGHGFKHGPAVGEHVADLLAGRVGGRRARFSLVGKAASRRPRGLLTPAGTASAAAPAVRGSAPAA